ncbi:flagellin [Chryseomicrobium palamuruense]|uniref:Flagellin n=1 Tax=Chryseomicrobium palamuruense TaxID=682973 RepID=A0ABV8UXV7_9BACL
MRISHQMLHNQTINRMQQNASRMAETYEQAASGKKVVRASDSPQAAVDAMKLHGQLAEMEQFKANQDKGVLFMDELDSKLQNMSSILQRINELGIQANSDVLFNGERDLLNKELGELTEELKSIASHSIQGEFLFTGSAATGLAPGQETSPAKHILAARGTAVEVSIPAETVFGPNNELFDMLSTMKTALDNNEHVDLGAIKESSDRVADALALTGARKNRLDSIQNRMEDSKIEQKALLSKVEDIDFAEVLTKLKSEEAVYQASLAATSKLYTTSLVDYLR